MDLLTTIMICSAFSANSITNAMIETGSHENPLTVTTISQSGTILNAKSDFSSPSDAASYVRTQLAAGNHAEIGMMQIPSGWLDKLSKNGVRLEDLFRPCKNVAVASDLLNQSAAYCATITDTARQRNLCALSFYKTGTYSPKASVADETSDQNAALTYAAQILNYAKAHPVADNPLNPPINYQMFLKSNGYSLPEPSFKQATTTPAVISASDKNAAADIREDVSANEQQANADDGNHDDNQSS